ncbi:hypothetical protein FRC12_015998 [Ceratobasidium sp. 428]|nr:hypothetical protein FRC12_015998 [Ceratobasidium sp. 428]
MTFPGFISSLACGANHVEREITQADILGILQQARGDLKEVWFEIGVLQTDAPDTEDVNVELKALRQRYRRLASFRSKMIEKEKDRTVFSYELMMWSYDAAKDLTDQISGLHQDVQISTRRIHRLSSTVDVSVSRASTLPNQGHRNAEPANGLADIYKWTKKVCAKMAKKSAKKSRVA